MKLRKIAKYLVGALDPLEAPEFQSCYDAGMAKLASSQSRLYVDHVAQMYPYHVWFDGQAWELEKGVDYHCSTLRLRSHLYNVADSFGHRLRTRAIRDGLIVQAVDKVTGKPLTP